MAFQRYGLLFIVFVLFSGCQQKSQHAFYYWKTVFRLTPAMEQKLNETGVHKIYVRFFDVAWDDVSASITPLAKISFRDPIPNHFEMVPVVYITNRTFQKIDTTKAKHLSTQILSLVSKIAESQHLHFNELQIDCDWSESTREAYFAFLKSLANQINSNVVVSATIRLHQVKYPLVTGIPPVKRGMLMFYNMGKLGSENAGNSIYNPLDASHYVKYAKTYPLPLDVALPLFSWAIHIRNHQIIDLINPYTLADFESSPNFRALSSGEFVALKSFFLHGLYFMKDDVVRIESVESAQCLQAAKQLAPNLKTAKRNVALFQLDSLTLEKNEKEKLLEIYHALD